MPLKTYTIEIKVDTDKECHEALKAAMAQHARAWTATAALLTSGKQPRVACRTTDAFYNEEEIDFLADEYGE